MDNCTWKNFAFSIYESSIACKTYTTWSSWPFFRSQKPQTHTWHLWKRWLSNILIGNKKKHLLYQTCCVFNCRLSTTAYTDEFGRPLTPRPLPLLTPPPMDILCLLRLGGTFESEIVILDEITKGRHGSKLLPPTAVGGVSNFTSGDTTKDDDGENRTFEVVFWIAERLDRSLLRFKRPGGERTMPADARASERSRIARMIEPSASRGCRGAPGFRRERGPEIEGGTLRTRPELSGLRFISVVSPSEQPAHRRRAALHTPRAPPLLRACKQ